MSIIIWYLILTSVHGKPIQEFEFSSGSSILASSTRNDCLLRLWNLPLSDKYQESIGEHDVASVYLTGHEKKIDLIKFHSKHMNVVASSSRYEILDI